MAISVSSARQIEALVADLVGGTDVKREAAVARLTVIGARAVERLIAVAQATGSPSGRVAAFRTLEAIADPRALDPALRAIGDRDPSVAEAAIGAARAFIRGPRGAEVVDRATLVVLDRNRPEPVRVAALRALTDLERSTVAPLMGSLTTDPSATVRAEAAAHRAKRSRARDAGPLHAVTRAAEHGLPDDPRALHDAIAAEGHTAALPLLLRIIERIRERESSEPPERRLQWQTARAAAHAALARRGSRIAVYDLRESLGASPEPLPVEFLSVLSSIGDVSCLEAIAVAYARSAKSNGGRPDWWRQHLANAFRQIARREKITRRHTLMKRIEKRWPQTLRELWAGEARRTG